MKYPLNFENSCNKSLLFWISRFLKFKLSNLSNRLVRDKDRFAQILQSLVSITDIKELSSLVKEARNLGLNGINTYFKPLENLYIRLSKLGFAKLEEIDEEVIIDFLAVSTSKLSDSTKKNYKNAIVNFFKYIDKQNEENERSYHFDIVLNNWAGLRASNANKLPEFLNEQEIQSFMKAINNFEFKPKVAYRNRLILKLILFTGIRVGEALSIKIKDIYPQEDVYIISITGKGNKVRTVMLKQDHISEYFDIHVKESSCNNNLLFCNRNKNALTQSYISRLVEQILISCGIRKAKNGAHLLRHSFATLLYQKSKDLVLVQEALGHASLNTSRIYTHFDKDKLYKATQIMDDL